MAEWQAMSWNLQPNQAVDESILLRNLPALENMVLAKDGQHVRFPGDVAFAELPGTRTYLYEYQGNLIAVTNEGRFYRVDGAGNMADVTGVPLSGPGRPTFSETEDFMIAAQGAAILKLAGATTEVLSPLAPDTTHIAFIDGFIAAPIVNSMNWNHNEAGDYADWNPLDVFSAESSPDAITAMVKTPYNELLFAGPKSVEQWERGSGSATFAFRYATGAAGVRAPYTLVATERGNFAVNGRLEFAKFTTQGALPASTDIAVQLQKVDDWREAWATEIRIKARTFILLQIPRATNPYGTSGLCFLFDLDTGTWTNLYGWDNALGLPMAYAAWSYAFCFDRHFIGVAGGIRELKLDSFQTMGGILRCLARTPHMGDWGPSRVEDVKLRFKRGLSPSGTTPKKIGLRCSRDGGAMGRWVWRDFGLYGNRETVIHFGSFGIADTWQFEYQVTDNIDVELIGGQAYVTELQR